MGALPNLATGLFRLSRETTNQPGRGNSNSMQPTVIDLLWQSVHPASTEQEELAVLIKNCRNYEFALYSPLLPPPTRKEVIQINAMLAEELQLARAIAFRLRFAHN